ncbi:unnamed protein product [Paramecium sonneborni]|uniref:Protein kinase domain-containing protein n=1 Tax=Paramecium sonneborni TaxID=65129 RepID=A0A8S1RRV1_9CILI|nr:unnamed protein product [Paramecium sonneborni]
MATGVIQNSESQDFYDKSLDIWSLGVIWYEMLTEETLFQSNNEKNVFNKILNSNSSQQDLDLKILNNLNIQKKKKSQLKRCLKISMERIQLKVIIAAYNENPKEIDRLEKYQEKRDLKFEKEVEKIKQEQKRKWKKIKKKKNQEFEKQKDVEQIKREIKKQKEQEYAKQLQMIQEQQRLEFEEQIRIKEIGFNNRLKIKNNQIK